MSPNVPVGKKVPATSNIYTVLLALACGIMAATVGFVAYKCNADYSTLFEIIHP